jgi:hypothetical protein
MAITLAITLANGSGRNSGNSTGSNSHSHSVNGSGSGTTHLQPSRQPLRVARERPAQPQRRLGERVLLAGGHAQQGGWGDNEWQWRSGSGTIRRVTSMRSFWYQTRGVKPEVAVVVAVESGGWKIVVIIGKNGVAVWIVDSGETTSGSGAVGVVPFDA